jgi:hypothetical protein
MVNIAKQARAMLKEEQCMIVIVLSCVLGKVL